jgi:hypothetical protein
MSDIPISRATTGVTAPADSGTSTKAPWHPPTLEEVDYSATEAAGVGAVYDLTVYTGSV